MADDLDIQIDRMTATMSSMVTRLTQSIQQDVADIKAAYLRLADRFGSKDTGAAKLGTAVAKADAPAAAPSGPVGVQLVKVINGSGEPVPVTVLKEERSAVGGAITTGLGALGAFAGNFIGGIIGGASLPIVIGELIALVAEILIAAPIIKQILTLTDSAIGKVKDIIDKVPIILDLGIRIVLAYLEPVINFAAAFVKAGATLIGGFLDGLVRLVNDLFAKLPAYLSALITYLVDTALRPAITPLIKDLARALADTLASVLIGAVLAIGNVLLAAGRYLIDGFLVVTSYIGRVLRDTASYIADFVVYAITSALSKIPLLGITPSAKPTPPGLTAPSFGPPPDFGKELKDGFKRGAELGKSVAEMIFGPTPEKKKEDPQGGGSPKVAPSGEGPPTLKLDRFRAPTFEPPVFKAPRDSVLPDLLERTRGKPGEQKPELPAPAPGVGKPAAPTAAAPVAPVNFNGGITVNLNVARIDGNDAQTTARAIAENLLLEVKRMSEVESFRRGLPTGTVG